MRQSPPAPRKAGRLKQRTLFAAWPRRCCVILPQENIFYCQICFDAAILSG